MVRLQPPSGNEWFIELLGAPDTYQPDAPMKQYRAVKTSAGYFSICSFGFLALAEWDPLPTPFGIRIARPEMMALANMLHHERIGTEFMSGTQWKRSNKDLGRVLALGYLAVQRDRKNDGNDFDEWAPRMWAAFAATGRRVIAEIIEPLEMLAAQ